MTRTATHTATHSARHTPADAPPLRAERGTTAAHQHMRRVERAEKIAQRMDAALRVPGTGIRIGYDSLLGLVPGIGDTLALAPSVYILKLAHDTEASPALLGRMGFNLGVDWLIGLVPLIGDIFDVGWKANLRNAALLRADVERRHGTPTTAPAAGAA